MTNPYFKYFPKTKYNNQIVTDITRRFKIADLVKESPYLYMPYTITDDMRPEDIAEFYYGDVHLVWLVLLANNIVDPYTQWPIPDRALYQYMVKKYHKPDYYFYEMNQGVIECQHHFENTDPVILRTDDNIPPYEDGKTYYISIISKEEIGLAETVQDAANGNYLGGSWDGINATLEFDIHKFIENVNIHSNIIHAVNEDGLVVSRDTYLDNPSGLRPIRVYEYEKGKNDDKRTIWLVNKNYMNQIIEEYRKIFR